MDGKERRVKLLEQITNADQPVTGAELATSLNVSRQVIVSDVALIRSTGVNIMATPSGYMLFPTEARRRPIRVFACNHGSLDKTEQELNIIVEHGGKVRDVIIEHPIYGEITGQLMVSTTQAVHNLMERLKQEGAAPLSTITNGVHLHTVEAATEDALDQIEHQLSVAGILQENG